MKLLMPCVECVMAKSAPEALSYVELRDDGTYEVQCANGHRSSVILQNAKFDILFEFGAMALLDGYTREAVSSFAVSLERFYEYWTRATLFARGITSDATDEAWKMIASQSERQYGAFYMLYLREHGRAPIVLSSGQVTFRNNVIHKGYIPSHDKAAGYASDVLQIMIDLHTELTGVHPKAVGELGISENKKATARAQNPKRVNVMAISTMFGSIASSKGKKSFEDGLKDLEKKRGNVFRN